MTSTSESNTTLSDSENLFKPDETIGLENIFIGISGMVRFQ